MDYHPHVHLVMLAATLDGALKRWRTKRAGPDQKRYLFNHKALTKVFRAKMLAGIEAAGLTLPRRHPTVWVVDCKAVGGGEKALVYLGRYLYRDVIREQDILSCADGQVTFRYRDARSGKMARRTVSGARFLWLVFQHVLPKGFRRARNFGFLHPNSKRLIALLQVVLKFVPPQVPLTPRPAMYCPCCGGAMAVMKTRLPPTRDAPTPGQPGGLPDHVIAPDSGDRWAISALKLTLPFASASAKNAQFLSKTKAGCGNRQPAFGAFLPNRPWHHASRILSKIYFQGPPTAPGPGSSNKRFRSWQARSNLIR